MLKSVVVACCACTLALPLQARAEVAGTPGTVAPRTTLNAEVVEVQEHRSTGSVIIGDAIGGAALGGEPVSRQRGQLLGQAVVDGAELSDRGVCQR